MKMTINGISFTMFVGRDGLGNNKEEMVDKFIAEIGGRTGVVFVNDELSYGSGHGQGEPSYVVNRPLDKIYEDEEFYKAVGREWLKNRLINGNGLTKYVEAVFIGDDDVEDYKNTIGYTDRETLFINDDFEYIGDLYGWVK